MPGVWESVSLVTVERVFKSFLRLPVLVASYEDRITYFLIFLKYARSVYHISFVERF